MFGERCVMSKSVFELLSCWRNWFSEHSSFVWNPTPLSLLWSLWRDRSHRAFEGVEVSVIQLKLSFIRSLFEWSCVHERLSYVYKGVYFMYISCVHEIVSLK